MGKISILLVDDHAVVREGLRALLGSEEDMLVVGEAADGRQAVTLARQISPEVVVMDLSMPVLNGLEATRQILKAMPGTKVLVLTSYGDDDSVSQMTAVGAAGYLIKQTAANDLVRAIREVRRGNAFFSPEITKRLRDRGRAATNAGHSPTKSRELTEREAQVLQLIADGRTNKQISAELQIAVKTVEKHRQSVMNKLNIHEIAGLTRYAVSKGVVPPKVPALT